MASRKLRAIDLFSGSGGLTLGLKQAGFEVTGAIEIDPVAIETYRMNHPTVTIFGGDIRSMDAKSIRRKLGLKRGELDLMAGCPPCQGFSSIRTYNGSRAVQDGRNDLVFDYLRFVKEFRPKAIMMENVPALAKDHRMKIFQAELKTLGYLPTCNILNAADYEVPQRRRRMILLAAKNGPIQFAAPMMTRITVREVIGGMLPAGKSGDPLHDVTEKRSAAIMSIIRRIPKDGGSRRNMGPQWQLPCHKRVPGGFKDIYGRMKWDDISPTVTSGCTNPSKGRFLHPEKNRAITLREAALLQGFPRDYFFSLSGGKQGASLMIGNALPPRFIKHHAVAIKKHLSLHAK